MNLSPRKLLIAPLTLAALFSFAPQLARAQAGKQRPAAEKIEAEKSPAEAPPQQLGAMRPGRLVSKPPACHPIAESEMVRLDFENAPLQDLARELGRVTCKNFVLEPRLARMPVMVLSASETRVSTLWPTFLSVLAAHDLTLVDRAGHYVIVETPEATRSNVPSYGPRDPVPNEERMVTKVLEVKDRDLNAVASFLNIYKSPKGQVHPYLPGNILVITDFASSVARIEWLYAQMGKAAPKT